MGRSLGSRRRKLLVAAGAAVAIVFTAAAAGAVGLKMNAGVSHRAGTAQPDMPSEESRVASPILTSLPAQSVIPPGRARISVPILEYHYVRVNPDPRDRLGLQLSVTPADFGAQMDKLAGGGYHPIVMADLRAYFLAREPLPARPVVLTFDDGYADFFQVAYPILKKHGFKAVAYVVPGFFGRSGYMTAAQVQQLDDSGIVQIGSHTVNHPDLTKMQPGPLDVQLQASRATLEQLLGHPVVDFCYPSGRLNAQVVAAVAAAGYQTATTEQPGTEHSWPDRLAWTRVRVDGGERISDFFARLRTPEPADVSTLRSPTAIPGPSGSSVSP